MDKILEDSKKETLIIEEHLKDINYTIEEIKTTQIRKVFGNMEVKGLAKFFKSNENNYWNINQGNCDGIFLTAKGLEYARMTYSLYEFKNVKGECKKIKGVEEVLEIIKDQKLKFNICVYVGWFVIVGSILLFSEALYIKTFYLGELCKSNLFWLTMIVLIVLSFLRHKKYKSFKFYLK